MKLAASSQACALGAAIFGAVVAGKAAGGYPNVEAAQKKMCSLKARMFKPVRKNQEVYNELYKIYLALHNSFGGVEKRAELGWVMKKLFALKENALNHKLAK